MLGSHMRYPEAIPLGYTGYQSLVGERGRRRASIRTLLAGSVVAAGVLTGQFSASSKAQGPTVVDIGGQSGFQDGRLGHFTRGRACVAADFDLDGRIDFYLGNPGDESIVLWNGGEDKNGITQFELSQVLLEGELAWGAAAADYDNDGDYDLFITCGANEGSGP